MIFANARILAKNHAEAMLAGMYLIDGGPSIYQLLIFPCARPRIVNSLYTPAHEYLLVFYFCSVTSCILDGYREDFLLVEV